MPEEKKEEKITIGYTKQELLAKIADLEQDEDLNLFLKVQKGARKYEEYSQLVDIARKNKLI